MDHATRALPKHGKANHSSCNLESANGRGMSQTVRQDQTRHCGALTPLLEAQQDLRRMTDLSCIVRVESDQLMKRAAPLYGSILVMSAGSAVANPHGDQPKQAMFKTQQEAEAAAPGFGCEGAHQMGSMWMVCAMHEQADQHGHH